MPSNCLMTTLQNILREEEKQAFLKSVAALQPTKQTSADAAPDDASEPSACRHPLVVTHNQAIYQKGLARLLESFQLPLVTQLEGQLQARRLRLSSMQTEMENLRRAIAAASATSRASDAPATAAGEVDKLVPKAGGGGERGGVD